MLLDNDFVSDARVEKEAVSLIKSGAEVTVYCTRNEKHPDSENRIGIQINRVFDESYNAPLRKGYADFIKHHAKNIVREEFAVIHCHDFHMLSIGAEIKKIAPQLILIYDAHEYLKGWPYYQTATSIKSRLKGKIVWNKLLQKEKKEIKLADFVVTVSDEISKRLWKNYDLPSVPLVLNNFPYNFELETVPNYFHDKFNFEADQIVLVHSGTIYHTDEQLNELFKIVTENPLLKLVFIGNRPRFDEVKEMVSKNPQLLESTVYFHEYLPNQQANINLISSGDIGLLHVRDLWEAHKITFSNRFVEYIMAGLPVIGTPQTFTKQFNDKFDCCTFYSEDNTTELKDAIDKMILRYKDLKKNTLEARTSIDWEKESQKLIRLYQKVLNG